MSDEELIARLRSDHPDYLTIAAADRIAALTAQVAELEVKLGGALLGQWIDAGMPNDPAKAEAAALRAKVARLEGQIKDWEARIDDCEWSANSSLTEGIRAEMRAALTDGDKNE